MFNLKKTYGFNKKMAEAGAKMVVGPNAETDYILIKRIPNDAYKHKLSTIMMAQRRTLEILKQQDEAAHAAKDSDIFAEVLAETVIGGWGSGIEDDGKAIPFSVEAAKELLIKYPDFRSDCVDFASDKKNYPLEPDVDQAKKK
jgi:hypothetical protein